MRDQKSGLGQFFYRQDAKNAKVAKEYKEFLCDLCAFALKKQA